MSIVVRVDSRGRITIPKKFRAKLNIKEGALLEIIHEDDKLVLRTYKSNAEMYYGKFKVKKWPRDLDKFIAEAVLKWWKVSGM